MGAFLDALRELEDDALRGVERELKANAPVRSGALARSFRRESQSSVVSDAPYVNAVDKRRPFVDRSIDAAIDKLD